MASTHTSSAAAPPPTLRVVDFECGVDGGLDVALVGRARGGHDELHMTRGGGEWRQELVVMRARYLSHCHTPILPSDPPPTLVLEW